LIVSDPPPSRICMNVTEPHARAGAAGEPLTWVAPAAQPTVMLSLPPSLLA
jgi:hypothetical protein